jgi:hypothetical protein
MCAATIAEEHAVSMLTAGPVRMEGMGEGVVVAAV